MPGLRLVPQVLAGKSKTWAGATGQGSAGGYGALQGRGRGRRAGPSQPATSAPLPNADRLPHRDARYPAKRQNTKRNPASGISIAGSTPFASHMDIILCQQQRWKEVGQQQGRKHPGGSHGEVPRRWKATIGTEQMTHCTLRPCLSGCPRAGHPAPQGTWPTGRMAYLLRLHT